MLVALPASRVSPAVIAEARRRQRRRHRLVAAACALVVAAGATAGLVVVRHRDGSQRPTVLLRLYMRESASRSSVDRIARAARASAGVISVRFVSKGDALRQLRDRYPELARALTSNPFPDSFAVRVRVGEAAALTTELSRLPGLAAVRASRRG